MRYFSFCFHVFLLHLHYLFPLKLFLRFIGVIGSNLVILDEFSNFKLDIGSECFLQDVIKLINSFSEIDSDLNFLNNATSSFS